MDIQLNCQTCWPLRFTNCPDDLVFPLGLTPATLYTWKICDSQGIAYEGSDTTNGAGTLTISTTDAPFDDYPGLFNKYAGSFKLTIYDSNGDIVPFTVLAVEYTCVAFSMYVTVEIDDCSPCDTPDCLCWYAGDGVPEDAVGNNGDLYFDYAGAVYLKVAGAWVLKWTDGGGGGATNLGIANRTATTLDVTSSTGTDATVPQASTTEAGLLIATDKVKLNNTSGINTGDQVIPVTAAANGVGLNGTTVELGINPLNRLTTVECADFKLLLLSQIDAFKVVALEKSKVGDIHYAGTYAENTNTNLKAYINTRGATSTNAIGAELAMRDDISSTITGLVASETRMSGTTRGDLLLTVNTVVGVFTISEGVTADNGATGTLHSRTATQIRVLPLTGNWLTATSLSGNTSLATANISVVTTQAWAFNDHNNFVWMIYDEYEGFLILGHESADRPNVGVLIHNEVYLLDYPETRDDTGTIPQTNVLYTGPNGEVCSAPFSGSSGNTIYTGDDSLTGNRVVAKAGFNLTFNGAGRHIIEASNNHASDAATIIQGSNAGGGLDIELRAFGSGDIKINSLTSDPDYGSKVVHTNGILRTSQADKQFKFTSNTSFLIDFVTYATSNYFAIDSTSAAVTITLPVSATTPTLEFKIKDVLGNSSVNNITVVCAGTDTVDGAGSFLINNDYGCLTIVNNADGTWSVLYYYFP